MFGHSQLEKTLSSGRGEILGRIDGLLALIQSEGIDNPLPEGKNSGTQYQKSDCWPSEVRFREMDAVQYTYNQSPRYPSQLATDNLVNWDMSRIQQTQMPESMHLTAKSIEQHKTIDLTKSPASEEKQPRDLLDAFQSLKQLVMLRSEDAMETQAIESDLRVLESLQLDIQSNHTGRAIAEDRLCSEQSENQRMRNSAHHDKYSSIAAAVTRLGLLLTSEEQKNLWMQIHQKLLLSQSESAKPYFTFNHAQEEPLTSERLAQKDSGWMNAHTTKEAQSLSTRHTNQSAASFVFPAEQCMLRKSSSSRMNGNDTFAVLCGNTSREKLADRTAPSHVSEQGILPSFQRMSGPNLPTDSGYFSSLGTNSQFSFTPFAANLNSNDAGMRLDFFEMKKDRDLASGRGLSSRGHSYRKGEFQTQSEIEFGSPAYNSRKYQMRSPIEVENIPITVMSNNSQIYGPPAVPLAEPLVPQTDYKFIAKSPMGIASAENVLLPPVATYLRFDSSQERAIPCTSLPVSEVRPFLASITQDHTQMLSSQQPKPAVDLTYFDYNPWSNQDLSDYRNMFTGDTRL